MQAPSASQHHAPLQSPLQPTSVIYEGAMESPSETVFSTSPGTHGLVSASRVGAPGHLELVLLPVNDDGGDLLVHEYQDGAQESWDNRGYHGPPGIGADGTNEPSSIIPRWLGEKTSVVSVFNSEEERKPNHTDHYSTCLFVLL